MYSFRPKHQKHIQHNMQHVCVFVCACAQSHVHMYFTVETTLLPKKTETGKEKRRDGSRGYNEKRQCKNNIVASVGSHIYPLRFFQSKHSPFINERGTLLSTWKLHLRSWEERPHPGTFGVLPHGLEQTPPPLKMCSSSQYRRGNVSTSAFFRGLLQHHCSSNSNSSI